MSSTILVTLLYEGIWLFGHAHKTRMYTAGAIVGVLALSLSSGIPISFVAGSLANTSALKRKLIARCAPF
jgi:hypothetical protein